MAVTHYAHSLQNADGSPRPESEWEPLWDHLERVAELAGEFAGWVRCR